MVLVDTHTHLFLEQFDNDRTETVKNAIAAGVDKMFLPNVDNETSEQLMALCTQFPNNCYPVIGLHPTSVKENFDEELQKIEKLLEMHKFYGIGETGIDLYWDKTFFEQQKQAFSRQIMLALKNDLPIIIHSRDSFDIIIDLLHNYKNTALTGVFHSFTGSVKQAQKAIDIGFKLGINGIVTYKNGGLDKVLPNIDISNIVIETDSPFLPPVPHRGQRNESAYLVHVAHKLAEIYLLPYHEVAAITTKNALDLYKIHSN